MSTTIENQPTKLIQLDGELLPADKPKRVSPGVFDDAYIEEFVANPHRGKASAYRIATGDCSKNNRQRANVLHARLALQIDAALKTRALGAIGFSMNRLFYLAEHADSQTVQAACAGKLLEFGMKFNPPDIKNERHRTREEVKQRIEHCIENIEATTGKKYRV